MVEIEEIKSDIKLTDIKSLYIIKGVFSFLCEKQKLNMIIYNKELQKKLTICFEDYKNFSGKYKIGKKNGKGKEYSLNTNKLIFEGNYLNGEKNGKGKEYYNNGRLKFEGEYIKGDRNGKGKEYSVHKELIFEGEYLNGKRNGNGKEYKKMVN